MANIKKTAPVLANTGSDIDNVVKAFIADVGKEHGRTLQLGVAVYNSTLDVGALLAGKSKYVGKTKKGKVKDNTSEREQRRLALCEIAPSFVDVMNRADPSKLPMHILAVKESDKLALSSTETMFHSALFVAYALHWSEAEDVELKHNNKMVAFSSQRVMKGDGTVEEIYTSAKSQGGLRLALMTAIGKAAAQRDGLVKAPVQSTQASGGTSNVATTTAKTAGTVAAAIRNMKANERVDFAAETSTKEGLFALIEACYVAHGTLKLSDLVNDLATSVHFKDKVAIEGRVVADIAPKKKAAA